MFLTTPPTAEKVALQQQSQEKVPRGKNVIFTIYGACSCLHHKYVSAIEHINVQEVQVY